MQIPIFWIGCLKSQQLQYSDSAGNINDCFKMSIV